MPAPSKHRDPAEQAVAVELGARIRARRTKLGWSQERLAEAAGLHWSFISQAERGERSIRFFNLLKIAAALDGLDVGTLVRGITLNDEHL